MKEFHEQICFEYVFIYTLSFINSSFLEDNILFWKVSTLGTGAKQWD